MSERIEALRALAEAADLNVQAEAGEPGEWFTTELSYVFGAGIGAYMEAVSPAVVLKLLDVVDKARAYVKADDAGIEATETAPPPANLMQVLSEVDSAWDALRSSLEALDKP